MADPYEAQKLELINTPVECPICGGMTNEYCLSTMGCCYDCSHDAGDC